MVIVSPALVVFQVVTNPGTSRILMITWSVTDTVPSVTFRMRAKSVSSSTSGATKVVDRALWSAKETRGADGLPWDQL